MTINNPPGFVAARQAATDELHAILKTSRSHPNPEHGKIIRTVCTRAILNIMVATSTAQIADILEKAQDKLKEAEAKLNQRNQAA